VPCSRFTTPEGLSGIVCTRGGKGSRPAKCVVCGRPYAERECDFRGPRDGTCNKKLCVVCAVVMGDDLDYCPRHGYAPLDPAPGEPHILVVSGKRRLTTQPDGPRGVYDDLRVVATDAEVVVTGDAEGPDQWAAEVARELQKRCLVYALDGAIHEGSRDGPVVGTWASRGAARPDPAHGAACRQWCLARNTVMVAHVAKKVRGGRRARVVGYLSYLPVATAGTEQTLRTAEESALFVRRLTVRPQQVQLRLVREA